MEDGKQKVSSSKTSFLFYLCAIKKSRNSFCCEQEWAPQFACKRAITLVSKYSTLWRFIKINTCVIRIFVTTATGAFAISPWTSKLSREQVQHQVSCQTREIGNGWNASESLRQWSNEPGKVFHEQDPRKCPRNCASGSSDHHQGNLEKFWQSIWKSSGSPPVKLKYALLPSLCPGSWLPSRSSTVSKSARISIDRPGMTQPSCQGSSPVTKSWVYGYHPQTKQQSLQ